MSDLVDAQAAMMPTIQQKDTTFTKIFVGGLPYHTTDKSLRQFFEAFGDIEEAVVITDRQTGKSRGYGFVTMADREAAERAVKDANPIIDGRKANVNLAYLGAKPRINAQNGFPSPLRTGFPLVIPSQYGSPLRSVNLLPMTVDVARLYGEPPSCVSEQDDYTTSNSLPPHYVYPSAYLPAPGLLVPGTHAPLSPAAAAANSFYAEYAAAAAAAAAGAAYPSQYSNGLEPPTSYPPFAAVAAGHHGGHPAAGGGGAIPPYLSPATAATYTYALQAPPPPPQSLAAATGAASHFAVPYATSQAASQTHDTRLQ